MPIDRRRDWFEDEIDPKEIMAGSPFALPPRHPREAEAAQPVMLAREDLPGFLKALGLVTLAVAALGALLVALGSG